MAAVDVDDISPVIPKQASRCTLQFCTTGKEVYFINYVNYVMRQWNFDTTSSYSEEKPTVSSDPQL